jgi:hypothetical protein
MNLNLPFQCKQSYDVEWNRSDTHCPNLAQTREDIARNITPKVHLSPYSSNYSFYDDFDSLVHLWSEWYSQYLQATYPRLIIRYEDTLYHAEKVTQLVANCSGWNLTPPFLYRIIKSKHHGESSDFTMALRNYGREKDRYKGMTTDDLLYANSHLDKKLMELFRYKWFEP